MRLGKVTLACLCGLVLKLAPDVSGAAYDVYLLAGQSNMDGQGLTNDLTAGFAVWNQPQTNVLIYYSNHYLTNYTASWQTLKPGWSSSSDGSTLVSTQFGPELSIGYVLATANPARHIALVKISKGGTSIENNWKPGKDMYANLTNAVPLALQSLAAGGNTYTVRGLLWHQGEADYGETHDYYLNLLTNFIAAVRHDLSLPSLPFVIGEISRDNPNPNYQIIRQAQYDASQMISNAYFVTSMNLPANTTENHFFSTAVIGLGQRFGSQASAFLSVPTAMQTWDLAGNGEWSTNSVRWTTDGGATHHAWSNGNDAAIFVATSGSPTVAVSSPLNAYGLTIATNASGYSLAGGTLTVGSGGITAFESTTISNALNLGGLEAWSAAAGKALIVGGPVNLSIHTLNVTGNGTVVVAGVVSDVGNDPTNSAFLYDTGLIDKTGTGTLTLLNSNIFTGGALIDCGVVQVGDGVSSNGVIAGNIDDNATLVFASPSIQAYGGIITGTGAVIKVGNGLLSMTGSNTYTGGTIINGGTVSISADYNLGGVGCLTLNNGGALQVVGTNDVGFGRAIRLGAGGGGFDINSVSNNLTISSPISGSGGFFKSGAGTVTVANTLTYTGATVISQGTLRLAVAPLNTPVSAAGGASLVLGPVSGLMGEYYNIAPTNVAGSNPNFVSLGDLNNHLAGQTPNLWALSSTPQINFDFSVDGSGFPNPYGLNGNGFEVRWTGTFNAPTSGTYTFDTASDDGSMLWIDGSLVVSNNAFQGLTTRSNVVSLAAGPHAIVVGYYQGDNLYGLYADLATPGNGLQRLPNSLLQYGATVYSIGSLSGDPGSAVNLGSYSLTINQTADGTFAGNISGPNGSLTKSGAANLTLSGSNTFTGGTAVSAGTLTLDYTSQNNNKISRDGPLILSGSTLKILGNASGSFTQQVSGLMLTANSGASAIINQSGNTLLDFTVGNVIPSSGASLVFRITGGGGIRLPGTTNTLFGPWAVTDTGDPAFLGGNNYAVPFTNYSGALPAAGADPSGNYLNAVGIVTNSETANLLNLRDAPSLFITNGAVLHLNFGLLFPGANNLSISGDGQLGASNASLVINTSTALGTNALTVGALISGGSGSLTKLGAGTLIVTNDNTYSGGTTLAGGTLQVGGGGTRGGLASGNITDNGTLTYNRGNSVTLSNFIAGTGVLVQAGSNTLVLAANNSYTGGTVVNSGTLSLNVPQNSTGATIVNNGVLLLNSPDQNRTLAYNGSVTVNAGGSVLVSNVNNVQNDESWTINGGVVTIAGGGHQHFGSLTLNGGTITTGPGSYAYDGRGNYSLDANVTVGVAPATLDANTGINLGALIVNNSAVTFDVADVTGNASPDLTVTTKLTDRDGGGTRGLVKTGAGTMLLNAASDYTGVSTVSNGVLMLGHTLAAQNSTVNNLASGGLAFGGTNVFLIGGLAGNGTIALSNASGAVTIKVGNNGSSTLYSGNLSGSGSLTKIGGGTLTLIGVNTYGGATTVSNGTLALSGSASITNSSAIIIASNATLDVSAAAGGGLTVVNGQVLNGSGMVNGNLTLADGAALVPGSPVGTLTFANNLVVGDTATLQYELGSSSDLTIVGGNLTLGGVLNISNAGGFTNGTYTLFTYGGTLTYHGLIVGTRPDWSLGYLIDTNTVGQVKLTVTNSSGLDPFVEWQFRYFNCTNCPQAAGSADPDGDGQNNLAEYLAGTNPTNGASSLRIVSVVRQGNDINVAWMTAGGRSNALQVASPGSNGSYSTNFVDLTAPPYIVVTGAADVVTNFIDAGGATNRPSRFYRVRLVP
ncbi:MAG TPA: autotransporter-associated beta strand repeat-containing protein [Verrucomicrobiae bacterium]|nr:autotransporter-associated beta strand repeat-containing protein [Verrucomicrobiae bacterium]